MFSQDLCSRHEEQEWLFFEYSVWLPNLWILIFPITNFLITALTHLRISGVLLFKSLPVQGSLSKFEVLIPTFHLGLTHWIIIEDFLHHINSFHRWTSKFYAKFDAYSQRIQSQDTCLLIGISLSTE